MTKIEEAKQKASTSEHSTVSRQESSKELFSLAESPNILKNYKILEVPNSLQTCSLLRESESVSLTPEPVLDSPDEAEVNRSLELHGDSESQSDDAELVADVGSEASSAPDSISPIMIRSICSQRTNHISSVGRQKQRNMKPPFETVSEGDLLCKTTLNYL